MLLVVESPIKALEKLSKQTFLLSARNTLTFEISTKRLRISLIKQYSATPKYYSTDYIPNHGRPIVAVVSAMRSTTTLWDVPMSLTRYLCF
jgi:hypothetical protein